MNRHTPTPGAATWSNSSIIDAYKEQVSYDANGNILTYLRNGAGSSLSMDNMMYKYSQGNNRLDHVNDAVSDVTYAMDIDNQDTLNYRYDNIGNLKKDAAEGIDSINWTVYGKIASIDKSKNIDGTVHHTRLDYTYDPAGNRVTKSFVESAGGSDGPLLTTYYARDAQGNVMGVYIDSGGVYAENKPIYWSEQHLYGSSRLGIWQQNKTIPLSPFLPEGNTQDSIMYGSSSYELTNHLGNVLATISDKKIGHALNDTTIDYFNADVVTANDYYPGGMLMPGRAYASANGYRYGFNGKENDDDVLGDGIQYDYGFRIYDARIVRFLSVDPLSKKYPWYTPYQFAGNKPIVAVDLDGREELIVIRWFDGNKYNGETVFRINNVNQRDASKMKDNDMQILEMDVSNKQYFESVVNSRDITNIQTLIKKPNGLFKGEYYKEPTNNFYKAEIEDLRVTDHNPNVTYRSWVRPVWGKETVLFKYASDDIRVEISNKALDNIKANLKADPERMIDISAYASIENQTDDPDYNKKLSFKRADAIKQFLVNHGVQKERILSVTGEGATDQFKKGTTEDEKAQNRRAEVKYTYKKKGGRS